jgi:hypothetical protein
LAGPRRRGRGRGEPPRCRAGGRGGVAPRHRGEGGASAATQGGQGGVAPGRGAGAGHAGAAGRCAGVGRGERRHGQGRAQGRKGGRPQGKEEEGRERRREGRGAHLGIQLRRSPSPKPRAPQEGERWERGRLLRERNRMSQTDLVEGGAHGVGRGARGAWAGPGRAESGHITDRNPRHARPLNGNQSRTEIQNGTRRTRDIRQRNMLRHDATPMTLRFLFIHDTDTRHYTGLKLGRRSETGREK